VWLDSASVGPLGPTTKVESAAGLCVSLTASPDDSGCEMWASGSNPDRRRAVMPDRGGIAKTTEKHHRRNVTRPRLIKI
jgi:hypothetical protein